MDKAQREREALDSMAATDVILPSQFFGAMGGGGLCSEQRLMLAVLVDAINILQGWNRLGSVRKRRAFAEASQWIITRGTHHPFAFDSVCDALGIDPAMLRGRLNGLAIHSYLYPGNFAPLHQIERWRRARRRLWGCRWCPHVYPYTVVALLHDRTACLAEQRSIPRILLQARRQIFRHECVRRIEPCLHGQAVLH